jgi:3-phenylpropionate/trans-cinnamate dioxygenase ferredoxin reductase subunit
MSGPFVIVGAGQAGVQIAESLRQEKYDGPITLLGAEAYAPYNRPPLSKKFLLDRPELASLAIRGPEALQRRQIDLQLRTQVTAIDRRSREVVLADGRRVSYGGLALTTGARLKALPLPGVELAGVFGLRTIDDALSIGAALDHCLSATVPLVVIGGGFIGLEIAATARKRGIEVTVLEGLGRLMSRVVAPIVSEAAARLHLAHGVRLLFDVRITALEGRLGAVSAVRTADGQLHPAGCVLVGVGVNPDDSLASAAGLECERGIIVDDCARSSDPLIVAAGDCTARRLADGSLLRLESVQNAVEQGKSAAAALLGRQRPFTAAPWFWSDQYDLKLQMVGLSQGYDEIVTRGNPEQPAFSAYYLRAGKLIAVDSLSRIADHMNARKLLDRGLTPTAAQIADEAFDLGSLLRA